MVETATQTHTCSNPELHSEHLCYVISQGMHLTDREAYAALVAEPRYICRHCERIARSGANLCVPTEL